MPKVEIYFVGVCTHLIDDDSHRVALVKAWGGDDIDGHPIDAHEAWLVYGNTQWDRVPLGGVSIRLNAPETQPTYDDSFRRCIERARDYAEPEAVDEEALGRAERIAAVFKCSGRYFGGISSKHGASVAKLEVETDDLPVLTITPLAGNTTQGKQITIELPGDAIVQIQNLGRDRALDQDTDFLLHYRIGTKLPEKPRWPDKPKSGCHVISIPYPYNWTGPGCANSTYP